MTDKTPSPAPPASSGGARRSAFTGGTRSMNLPGTRGTGGGRTAGVDDMGGGKREARPSEKWRPASDEPDDYEFVRLLHRSHDQGITAVSETLEQRQARAQQTKTTGWQSKFAMPYRPLGIPQLQVERAAQQARVETQEGKAGAEAQSSGRPPLSERARRVNQGGVTPSGRPMDWLPRARMSMEKFSLAARRNNMTHRLFLLHEVTASDRRVKFVRAGVLATDVLQIASDSNEQSGQLGFGEMEMDDIHPLERKKMLKNRKRPEGVPALKVGEGSNWAGGGGAQTDRTDLASQLRTSLATPPTSVLVPQTARANMRTSSSGSTLEVRSMGNKTPVSATDRGLVKVFDMAPMVTIEQHMSHAKALLTARQKAVAGEFNMQLPVPPLELVAEAFQAGVDELTLRVKEELSSKTTARLDTFRRKFKNFELGEMGSNASSQLDSMRLRAEQEKLRNEIYLYQNRKWYLALMGKVADQASDEQHDLLRIIREMVEGGVVFSKLTVRELVTECATQYLMDAFVTRPIQDVFDFLCGQFGVLGEEYDGWVEDAGLALPPSTIARYESARQMRLDLFKKDIVAKHMRQRFDMMSTTKPLDSWLPHDIVDTVGKPLFQAAASPHLLCLSLFSPPSCRSSYSHLASCFALFGVLFGPSQVMSSVRETHRRSPDSISNHGRAASSRGGASSRGADDWQASEGAEPTRPKVLEMSDARPHSGFGDAPPPPKEPEGSSGSLGGAEAAEATPAAGSLPPATGEAPASVDDKSEPSA